MPRQEAKESNCTGNISFDTFGLTMEGAENMGWGQNVKDTVKDWSQNQLVGRSGRKTKTGTRSKPVVGAKLW